MLWALVRFPLVTLRTIALIHWHALHLWRKGATFHSHGSAAVERHGTGGRPLVAVSSASPEPESASR